MNAAVGHLPRRDRARYGEGEPAPARERTHAKWRVKLGTRFVRVSNNLLLLAQQLSTQVFGGATWARVGARRGRPQVGGKERVVS